MIDIRYFVDRQNGAREATPALPTPAPARDTTVVRADERTALDRTGPSIEPLTSGKEESYSVMKGAIPPGVSVPLHSHGDSESFYVQSGEAQLLVQKGDSLDWQTLRAGDFVQIPPDAKHA